MSLKINQEDVWPHEILKHVDSEHVNEFIRQQTGLGEKLAELVASFSSNEVELFPGREIYSAVVAELNPMIARACREGQRLAGQISAVLTPQRQAAIRLERIRCKAEREFAALDDYYLNHTDHHERFVKRNLEHCAETIHNIYRALIEHEVSASEDVSLASNVAASVLIFMINGALRSYKGLLWEELLKPDYTPTDPDNFWTIFFQAFNDIIDRQGGLTAAHISQLQIVADDARKRTELDQQRMLHALDVVIGRSL
jgi:hypothetical protein